MAGFGAGLVHVLFGPDHLAAVAPLSLGKGKRGWRIGLQWGMGHAGGVLLIGLLALVFRELLPVDAVSFWAERVVGLTLIGLGAWALGRAFTGQMHETSRAAVAVGALHGLAGSSHLFGIIPALLFPGAYAAGAYLIAFGGGTLAGMVAFSTLVGCVPMRVYRPAMAISACLAMGLGCYWTIA